MPEGGAAETITQLLGQNFQNQFFINQSLFAPLRTLFYANSMLCCCFHREGLTHICHMHFFTQKSMGHSIYSNVMLGRCFSLNIGLAQNSPSCSDGPRLSALVYSSPYLIPESVPRKQTAVTWGVPSQPIVTFGQNRVVWGGGSPGQGPHLFLPSHQMLF